MKRTISKRLQTLRICKSLLSGDGAPDRICTYHKCLATTNSAESLICNECGRVSVYTRPKINGEINDLG